MKIFSKLSLFALIACFSLGLNGQGIEFFHGSWEEALAKSEAEGKLIFVDAYASWCGPCKKMAANVFPLKEVGDYFNANFINMKFDMEKAESTEFREKHSVRAFPTLFFINGKNEVVHQVVGGKQAQGLISAGGAAMAKMDDLPALGERWESGDRDSKLAFTYIRALVRRGEPHMKVANDYLRTQKDLKSEDNLNILLIAATTADSRIFDLMMQHKAGIIAQSGQSAFDQQVRTAVNATKDRAIEFKDESLLKTAVKKLSSVDPTAGKQLALQGAYELAAKGTDSKAFYKATSKYLDKAVGDDINKLTDVYKVVSTSRFIHEQKILDLAVDAGSRAAAGDPTGGFQKYYRLADFLFKQGRGDQALGFAKLAKEALDPKQANYIRAVDGLIKRIEEAR
jgi:thiol-disulfide isomerase/thioredoxin